jgi:hypothetical protein
MVDLSAGEKENYTNAAPAPASRGGSGGIVSKNLSRKGGFKGPSSSSSKGPRSPTVFGAPNRLFFPIPAINVEDPTFAAKLGCNNRPREVAIQQRFENNSEYFQIMTAAVMEELQRILRSLADVYWSTFRSIQMGAPRQVSSSTLHRNLPSVRPEDLPEKFKKKAQLEFFVDASLEWSIPRDPRYKNKYKRGRGDDDDDERDFEPDPVAKPQPEETKFFLRFKKGAVDNFAKKKWRSGDFWILCVGRELANPSAASKSRSSTSGVYIFKSTWRCPGPDNSMRVEVLGVSTTSIRALVKELLPMGRKTDGGTYGPKKSISVMALRGNENQGMMVDVLNYCSEEFTTGHNSAQLPLLRSILSGKKRGQTDSTGRGLHQKQNRKGGGGITFPFAVAVSQGEIDAVYEETCKKFHLNRDQCKVIKECAKWFTPPAQKKGAWSQEVSKSGDGHPIVLVHGVFGAGKSTLLVAVCFFIDQLMHDHDTKCERCGIKHPLDGRDMRILLASSTNKAVDNVMEALLNKDFNAIARIGDIQRITSLVKSFHVPQKTFTGDKYAKQVSKPLPTANDDDDDDEMDGRTTPALTARQMFDSARVVGTTCAAANVVLKEGPEAIDSFGTFPIVLFDESSQIVEPVGLIPLRLVSYLTIPTPHPSHLANSLSSMCIYKYVSI